jgi:hypothetical protein
MCAVDEFDTPESLTDLNYSGRGGPAPDMRRVNFTLGTWAEDEDPFTSWWKNRCELFKVVVFLCMCVLDGVDMQMQQYAKGSAVLVQMLLLVSLHSAVDFACLCESWQVKGEGG